LVWIVCDGTQLLDTKLIIASRTAPRGGDGLLNIAGDRATIGSGETLGMPGHDQVPTPLLQRFANG
jgi:hypothetical protein